MDLKAMNSMTPPHTNTEGQTQQLLVIPQMRSSGCGLKARIDGRLGEFIAIRRSQLRTSPLQIIVIYHSEFEIHMSLYCYITFKYLLKFYKMYPYRIILENNVLAYPYRPNTDTHICIGAA
jgi:hypothetical protein